MSHQAVSRQFGVSHDAVWRHARAHISAEHRAQLLAGPIKLHELAQRAADEGLALLDYLGMIRSALLRQFFAAGEASDRQGMGLLSGRLTELLRLSAQLTGELSQATSSVTHNTVNVFMHDPGFLRFMEELTEALADEPAARRKVLQRFDELERREAAPALEVPQLEHHADDHAEAPA